MCLRKQAFDAHTSILSIALLLLPILSAQIAQLVEQRTENPRVTGSIPVLGTELTPVKEFFYFTFGNVLRQLFRALHREMTNKEPQYSSYVSFFF